MNGMHFLKALREQEYFINSIPVIILSAYEDQEKWLSVTSKSYGLACHYLKKPFRKNTLLETINRVFNGETNMMIDETAKRCFQRLQELKEVDSISF